MNDRTEWFRQAKLGMFIHWGPYSVAGVEASWPIMVPRYVDLMGGPRIAEDDYVGLASRFDPSEFDALRWVRTAKRAGMRYLVFTAKHHDGFCMFDAPGTEYKITRTAFARDVVGELADACRTEEVRFGLYYSPPDMHHPGYRDTSRPVAQNWFGEPERREWHEYLDYMEAHLRHLLTAYGRIDVLWFDGLFDQEKYDPPRFHRLAKGLQPDILVNDRLGDEYDFITPEQGIPDGVPVIATHRRNQIDARTFLRIIRILSTPPIRRLVRRKLSKISDHPKPLTRFPAESFPAYDRFQPWETCMTMNKTWAYCPSDDRWKPTRVLLRILSRVVSRGGNLLLNVGPDSLGRFPVEAVRRLEAVGTWMDANGEAVYGTRYGRPVDSHTAVSSRTDDAIYVFVLERPGDGIVHLDGLHFMPRRAELVDTGEELPVLRSREVPALGVSEVVNDLLLPVVRLT